VVLVGQRNARSKTWAGIAVVDGGGGGGGGHQVVVVVVVVMVVTGCGSGVCAYCSVRGE
jgi:hypothetical protein